MWGVQGLAGGGSIAPEQCGGGKRRKANEPAAQMDEDEDLEQMSGDEPGFRALASITLADKPNWVAVVGDTQSERAVVCVATTSELIEVLAV